MAIKKTYIGIDPGKSGAIAFIAGESIKVFDFEEIQYMEYLESFNMDVLKRKPVKAVIEKVSSFPSQGVVGAFNFGMNYGIWLGRLEICGIPFDRVIPRVWQKVVFDTLPGKKKAQDRKILSLERARNLFPMMVPRLGRKKDHDRAEALLLAEYARRTDII